MSFSPDGRWWWDGHAWVSATSPDGLWRWDGSAWRATSGQASRPGWVRAIFGLGPIVGGLATGAIFWIPTHDLSASSARAGITWAGLVLLRLFDPLLAPAWRILGKVPGILRWLVALAVAAWFSIGQLGPNAVNQEIAHFQAALFVSVAVAYALIRPSRGGYGAQS